MKHLIFISTVIFTVLPSYGSGPLQQQGAPNPQGQGHQVVRVAPAPAQGQQGQQQALNVPPQGPGQQQQVVVPPAAPVAAQGPQLIQQGQKGIFVQDLFDQLEQGNFQWASLDSIRATYQQKVGNSEAEKANLKKREQLLQSKIEAYLDSIVAYKSISLSSVSQTFSAMTRNDIVNGMQKLSMFAVAGLMYLQTKDENKLMEALATAGITIGTVDVFWSVLNRVSADYNVLSCTSMTTRSNLSRIHEVWADELKKPNVKPMLRIY